MYPYATTKKSLSLSWSDWHIYNWDTVHKVAPLKSGVYVLAVKMASGGWEKFYIGQAELGQAPQGPSFGQRAEQMHQGEPEVYVHVPLCRGRIAV